MTLFFGNSERARCISHPQTIESVFEDINRFLKEKNYKSYYTRTYTLPNGVVCYDVGSWSQFFYSAESDLDFPDEWEQSKDNKLYNINEVI